MDSSKTADRWKIATIKLAFVLTSGLATAIFTTGALLAEPADERLHLSAEQVDFFQATKNEPATPGDSGPVKSSPVEPASNGSASNEPASNELAPNEPALMIAQQFSATPLGAAIERALGDGAASDDEQELKEFEALVAFYKAREFRPLWIGAEGANDNARAFASEIANADAWGLEAKAFELPKLSSLEGEMTSQSLTVHARVELALTRVALLYARHARGGRIMDPAAMLNSNLDRKPKLLDPAIVLQGLADAHNAGDYLQGLHPQHPQFQHLRHAFLARRTSSRLKLPSKRPEAADAATLTPKQQTALRKRLGLRTPATTGKNASAGVDDIKAALEAFQTRRGLEPTDGELNRKTVRALNSRPKASTKKLLSNMEQWRWMWEDMGDVHVLANVPEFMLNVYKAGEIIHTERIVAGETGKQTSIFTRTLKHVVLRPMWRVPESIKVRELWPNLRRGGSMFRKYNLRLESKDGKRLNYRKVDWSKADIRDYEVVQPPGRGSTMGVVKFSFPSQHTIFMHDTPDKYMFNRRQRTLSHGCLRVRNPVELARILLAHDKGWSASHVDGLIKSGPNDNKIGIEKRIPIHLTYFTAWAKPDGTVATYRDVYGHEKRISLALQGKWKKINKGRDHLAKVQPLKLRPTRGVSYKRKRARTPNDHIRSALGGGF